MSTSLIYHDFGLTEQKYLKTEYKGSQIIFYVETKKEHLCCSKCGSQHVMESKQVLGLSQFQTRKWQAWQHQVALNLMTACFVLKEKLFCFDDLPLLSAWDIKEWICYKLSKHVTDENMIERMYIRHLLKQMDINKAYSKEKISNVSKWN